MAGVARKRTVDMYSTDPDWDDAASGSRSRRKHHDDSFDEYGDGDDWGDDGDWSGTASVSNTSSRSLPGFRTASGKSIAEDAAAKRMFLFGKTGARPKAKQPTDDDDRRTSELPLQAPEMRPIPGLTLAFREQSYGKLLEALEARFDPSMSSDSWLWPLLGLSDEADRSAAADIEARCFFGTKQEAIYRNYLGSRVREIRGLAPPASLDAWRVGNAVEAILVKRAGQ
nr:hypothetical protein HK105_001032 [Polyrhizophydium stewartii]